MSWKIYKSNDHYIQGDLLSTHSSESAALKNAKKNINYSKTFKEESKEEIVIWLDDADGIPAGIIIKSIKGTKRLRQSKKEE